MFALNVLIDWIEVFCFIFKSGVLHCITSGKINVHTQNYCIRSIERIIYFTVEVRRDALFGRYIKKNLLCRGKGEHKIKHHNSIQLEVHLSIPPDHQCWYVLQMKAVFDYLYSFCSIWVFCCLMSIHFVFSCSEGV